MTSLVKQLARAVEKHPLLYNQAAQTSAKKDDYDEAWQAVSEECDKPIAVIKSRWSKTIKSLINHLSNPTAKNTARKTRSSEFQFVEELEFLLPFVNNQNESNSWENASESDQIDSKNELTVSTAECETTNNSKTQIKRDSSTDSCHELRETDAMELKKPNVGSVTAIVNTSVLSNDKRKREMTKKPTPSSSSPTIRFRRFVEDPIQIKQQREKNETLNTGTTSLEEGIEQPVAALNKLLRNRSRSMYMDRKTTSDENSDDADAEYQPPSKKIATSKSERSPASTKMRSRTRMCTVAIKKTVNAAIRSPMQSSKAAARSTPKEHNIKAITKVGDIDDSSDYNLTENSLSNNVEFGTGIDMSLIEAAAAAEDAAAREDSAPVYATDTGTQCSYEADEEDDEFLERTRLWLQRMNPRQKLVFRKGVYQAFLDVYDDPRNFDIQKGSDKFVITQLNGMPALFTGMSPIELRLVRQLAIAVAGSKLNSPVVGPKTSGSQDVKCKAPSMLQVVRPSLQQQQPQTTAKTTSPPNSLSSMRTQPIEKQPAVLRTTAIALSNQARSQTGMHRVLRKVVRVDNSGTAGNNSEGGGAHSNGSSGSSSSSGNNNNARARTVCVNSGNGSNPQRIYRILPNGNIMRHCPGSSGTTSSSGANSNDNSQSHASGTQPLSSSNTRLPTTSTLTTSTGTVITTRNISKPNQTTTQTQMLVDPKTGYFVRRQVVSSTNGSPTTVTATGEGAVKKIERPPMSRRYSICSIPRELQQQQQAGVADQQHKILPKLPINSALSSSTSSPKPIVRVRYAQNQSVPTLASPSAPNSSRSSGSGGDQFILPAAVSPRRQQHHTHSAQAATATQRDSPVPVLISTSATSNVGGENSEAILKRAQQVYENALLAGERANASSSNCRRSTPSTSGGDKANCLITSDMIDNFVVKNEPLDLEDEDVSNDFMEE